MNVFIISVARSGSYTLTNAFSKVFNSTPIREPYNTNLDNDLLFSPKLQKNRLDLRYKKVLPKKWVVKSISDQVSYNDALTIKDLSDLTILLGRRNTQEKNESLNFATNNLIETWHKSYIYKKEPISDNILKLSYIQDEMLKVFSELLEIPITYYEDLYFDEEFRQRFSKDLGDSGPKILSYLDKRNKYRKEKSNI